MPDFVEQAKRFLAGRGAAYRRVFAADDADAQVVLADLALFCRAHRSTAHPDPQMAARLDGRREAWLRIADHLKLSTDQLYELYGRKPNV